jgi:GntR family transcriptional repressor for pyruvate dehydrogenase complex
MPLEAAAAKLAAQRRSSADLARVIDSHERFRQEFTAGEANHETDMAFHAAIAAATANEFFQHLLDQIRDVLSQYLQMSLSLNLAYSSSEAQQQRVIEEHSCIVDAIKAQDGDRAEVAMQFHIGQALRRMIERCRDV